MTVLPGAVSQIEWNAVSPGTTVTAGSTLTVSGFALNSLGKPVPNGTEVVVQMPGTSTQPRTVYTSNGTGYFTAQLTVTNLGSWNLQAVASGQTFTYGSPTPILVNAGAPASIVIWGETVGQTIPLGMASAGFGMSVLDEYGNPCPNIAPVLSMTASNGGRVPLPLSQPGPTGGFGQTGADEGPFDYAGNYTITATYGSVSTTDGFAVAANAPEVYSITDLQYHIGGNTYNFSGSTVNIPAGTTVTVTGTILNQFGGTIQGVINVSFSAGSSGLSQYVSNTSGYFSGTVTPYTTGSQSMGVCLNTNSGFPAEFQSFNVTPGPVSNVQVILNPPSTGQNNCPQAWIGYFNVVVLATDAYNNLIPSATATISTTTTNSTIEIGMPDNITITNGIGEASGLNIMQSGIWPITVTVGGVNETSYLNVY